MRSCYSHRQHNTSNRGASMDILNAERERKLLENKEKKYVYTYGYDVTKETYPERIERAKKEKSIIRMVMQLLATVRLPMI